MIEDQPARVEMPLYSTSGLFENTNQLSLPCIISNPNQNQQIPLQSSVTPLSTIGTSIPSYIIYNPYYTDNQFVNSNVSPQANVGVPIQALPPNNQGGNVCPIYYINSNNHLNHDQNSAENMVYGQTVRLESSASVLQSNQIYMNGGCTYINGKHNQGYICPTCKKVNDDPYYRQDFEIYVCRYCGGGLNNGQNQNINQSRKRVNCNKNDTRCSNCETTITSLWRRSNTGRVVCNACGLYFKIHGITRPISLKKDVIKTRTRRSIRTVRLMMSNVVAGNQTQAQYQAQAVQAENHVYQGNSYFDYQAQANHGI
ncbi:Transcription factor BCFI [Thelohanellus kitauei]|uniref:Transcription factor BCFI n=1 Tax=Thelohanellus kitauei TaxID=669202 RepID=A0A0C2IHF4_THEKT|nr:Transcription factor BCFI [Thelohanellus kitauei]